MQTLLHCYRHDLQMLLRLDLFAIKSNAMIKLRLEELLIIDSDMNLKMCNMNLFSMPILKVFVMPLFPLLFVSAGVCLLHS